MKPKRILFNEDNREQLDKTLNIDFDSDMQELDLQDKEELKNTEEDQVIEVEMRGFHDLGKPKDIYEYCKPFSYDSLVLDSDDVCKNAVVVCRKLLDERADEFSLSMLQAISDVKEHLEDNIETG